MNSAIPDYNVLIVNKSFGMLYWLMQFLGRYGFRSTGVPNTSKAIERFKYTKFDAIVVDIDISQLAIEKFLRKLKEINQNIPVILITGYFGTEDTKESEKLDVFDYIIKPINLYQLVAILNKAIKQYNNLASLINKTISKINVYKT